MSKHPVTGRIGSESGIALITLLLMVAIGLVVTLGAVGLASSSTRSQDASKVRTHRYFEVESGLGQAMAWFRSNATKLVTPYRRENFYARFDRTDPTVGSNDTSVFTVPTRVKLKGTNNSAMLVSDNSLGTAEFPSTSELSGGASFDAKGNFDTSMNGNLLYRATLVDVIAVDPTKDYGPPPATAPATDFYPIYRLDVMNAMDRGAHTYGYVIGTMTYADTVGFYGKDFVEVRQSCDSYISADGAYGGANKRARCPIGSDGTVSIHQNEEVYGSVRTNGGIASSSPYGGKICSDFANGCPNAGTSCAGPACAVPALPTFQTWTSYCPTNQGNRTVNTNQTWTLAGGSSTQNCWATVGINSNRTLTLRSTDFAYYIDVLSFANSSNARLNISPNPSTGAVTLYTRNFSGGTINGNNLFNVNNRPSQFRLYYLGTNALTFNGTAAMNASVVAPYADVTISGNFTFQGGIIAKSLTFTGNGSIHYDESLGGTALQGLTYRMRDQIQYYR